MKILFISPYLPSPLKPRSLFFLKNLLELGNSAEILVLEETGALFSAELIQSRYKLPNINTFKLNRLFSIINASVGLLGSNPLQVNYCRSKNLELTIKRNLESRYFDIVHVENIRAMQFVLNNNFRKTPIVFDAVDCLSHRYSQFSKKAGFFIRPIFLLESLRLKTYERQILHFSNHTIVTTQTDKNKLLNVFPYAEISVISNGINTPPLNKTNDFSGKKYLSPKIAFWGKMDYFPNKLTIVHFVKQIFPIIKILIPNIELRIIGASPDNEIRNLERFRGVKVTGFIDSIGNELKKCSIAVFPMVIGTGIQNKLLEAMAYGLPVICSSLAAKPLNLINNKHAIINDDVNDFAKSILSLLESRKLSSYIRKNAYNFVKKNHQWVHKAIQLQKIYEGLTHGKR